jgi:hypothetical protein
MYITDSTSQVRHNWRTIGKPAGLIAGVSFLLSRMSPVIEGAAGEPLPCEADPSGLILDTRIPGSAARSVENFAQRRPDRAGERQ